MVVLAAVLLCGAYSMLGPVLRASRALTREAGTVITPISQEEKTEAQKWSDWTWPSALEAVLPPRKAGFCGFRF